MQPKLLALLLIIGLGGACMIGAQETSPSASPSPAKHHSHKKAAETTATSPAAENSPSAAAEAAATASPAEKKHGRKAKPATPEASPAATVAASASPAAAPAAEMTHEVPTRVAPEPGGGHGTVWVNTESHIYHKEGSRFYGKTKKGKYMIEADAIKEGDKEAKGEIKAKPH